MSLRLVPVSIVMGLSLNSMVELYNLELVGSRLEAGRYTGEQVMKHFRYFYGDNFSSHDLNKACKILGWKKTYRGSGRGHYITVLFTL